MLEMLTDHERCRVMLVTLPEETPVNELVDTAFSLEDRVGVGLGPVVVNGHYDDLPGLDADPAAAAEAAGTSLRRGEAKALAAAAAFRRDRMALQDEQTDRLADQLPLAQIRLPVRVHRGDRPGRARPARRPAHRRGRGAPGGRVTAGPRPARAASWSAASSCAAAPAASARPPPPRSWRSRRRGPGAGRSSSRSTPPSGSPTPSGSRASPARPARIDGDWPGELWALMLDTKSTFDDLVVANAATPEQGTRILENRFYRNISGALSGTQEYMAMEKLYELHQRTDFDLVVVDTPPTRNALDFIDAPRRLSRFLDHRLFRMVTSPGRGVMKAVNVAAQTFLRTVAKVVGGEVIDDAVAFFQAFEGMEEGFRERADAVLELLSADETAFVLVASPRRDTIEEAQFFAAKLAEADITVRPLIVNRMHPTFGKGLAEAAGERAATLDGHRPRRPLPQPGRLPAGGVARGAAPRRPGRARWRRRRWCACRSCPPTSTTSTASPTLARADALTGAGSASRATVGAGLASARAAAASSTVSVTDTMRSKPVVCSRRVSVGRLHATATSPPASRARRMPPMSAPRPGRVHERARRRGR